MKNIFEKFVINNELFVDENEWSKLQENYDQKYIIQQISDAIVEFDIKLPYRDITHQDMVDDYLKLKELDSEKLIKEGAWLNKFEYLYPNIDKYVDLSNVGNKASDYFHQIERWKCDATGYPSPEKTWKTEKFRLTLFKALFSLKLKEINPDKLRNIIALRKYIASQFRPSTAKAIYDYFKAESVLDFSMGWGDRLLGAHASKSVKRYVGFDPNTNLYDNYHRQLIAYALIDPNDKSFDIYPTCAEDESIILKDEFDLVFTSPPYFDKEKYDQSTNQSYIKHKKFDSWLNDFLFKTIELRTRTLKSGGHLVINISDIYTRHQLFKICDPMNDYINSTGQFEYVGAMGFRMPKRPQSKSSNNIGIFGEPIWIFCKK
jgi:hypothetical protein